MTIILDLPPEVEGVLTREAQRQGTNLLPKISGFCLISFLLLIPSRAPSAPVPTPAAAIQTPVQVVQHFLEARTAGHYEEAYALLSPETHLLVSYGQFSSPDYMPPVLPPNVKSALMPSLLKFLAPIRAFFLDPHNTQGFRYSVGGAAPGQPSAVMVSATSRSGDVTLIPIVVVPYAEIPNDLRLDYKKTSFQYLSAGRERARQAVSQSNLRILSLGILQYALDHEERFPHAGRWVEAIMPYVKDQRYFRDPSAPPGQDYSYAFNQVLSGKSLATVAAPASTVMLFESNKGVKNASDTGQSVPKPGRHNGGTDYGFADGHVKWLLDSVKPSFALARPAGGMGAAPPPVP